MESKESSATLYISHVGRLVKTALTQLKTKRYEISIFSVFSHYRPKGRAKVGQSNQSSQ